MSEVKVDGTLASTPNSCESNWKKSAKSPIEKLGYILKHEQFSDVSFCVSENGEDGEVIKAHKLLLMTASDVFERMFNGSFTESSLDSQTPIAVPDVDPSSFKMMLQFIYTGEAPKNNTVSEAIRLVNAARKYDIGDLEERCWGFITKKLTVNDSVKIFQAAQLYENKDLEDKAFIFLQENFDRVLESEDFLNISFENLKKFISSDQIVVDTELEIFNGILRWSASKCKEKNMTLSPESQRQVLGDLINLINFAAIPAADVGAIVVQSEVLTDKDCLLLLQRCVVSLDQLAKLPKLPFSNVCRQLRTRVVKFSGKHEYEPADLSNSWFTFIFKVDKSIKIVGLGLLGHSDPTKQFIVSVIFKDTATSSELYKITNNPTYSCGGILHINLHVPLQINSQQEYAVTFMRNGPPISYSYSDGKAVTEHGVIFIPRGDGGSMIVPQIKFKLIT